MLRLLRLLFVLFVRSFCSRRDLLLENLALRQQLAVVKERRPRPRFPPLIGCFGRPCAASVPNGSVHLFWCSRRQSFAGIVPDSKCTGISSRGTELMRVEDALEGDCETSSSAWWPTTE